MSWSRRALALAGALALISMARGGRAAAQWRPGLGVGFVANAPSEFAGASVQFLSSRWGGIGLYADAKFDVDSPRRDPNFLPDLTVGQVEDEIGDAFFDDRESWRTFDVAVLRPVTPELMLYAGAGYTHREVYRQYLDPDRERSDRGHYWVEDPERTSEGVNGMAGAFFRIGSHLALQFGLETAPRGATVGATYRFGR